MLTTSLPLLPPPSSSLLPPFHTTNTDSHSSNNASHHQHPHRRPKHPHNSNSRTSSSLAQLTFDERAVSQRKLAIAMYGYSWLRPAGCSKTMLGRREEEIEREEVERQLAEVEMQERNAAMMEDQEREEGLRRQAEQEEAGGLVGEEGVRDLDDEIPDMDEMEGSDEEGDEDEEELGVEEDMEGDLDDEVPDADAEAVESSWVYDTNRDPDTESDNGENESASSGPGRGHARAAPIDGRGAFLGLDSAAETDAMVNAMLDEDEIGELGDERDLDDSIPDMDIDAEMEDEQDYDLDDDVPQADEEGEWQHTDTELEESEMDISVLPPGSVQQHSLPRPRQRVPDSVVRSRQRGSNIGPGTTHEDMRRVSGNIMIPPPAIQHTGQSSHQFPPLLPPSHQAGPPAGRQPRRIITPQYQTPLTLDNSTPSFLSTESDLYNTYDNNSNQQELRPRTLFTHDLRTTNTMASTANPVTDHDAVPSQSQSWLHHTGARRKLFGTESANVVDPATRITAQLDAVASSSSPSQQPQQHTTTLANRSAAATATMTGRLRSGGLFTPEPRAVSGGAAPPTMNEVEEPRSRTRSGRVVGGGAAAPRRRAAGVAGSAAGGSAAGGWRG